MAATYGGRHIKQKHRYSACRWDIIHFQSDGKIVFPITCSPAPNTKGRNQLCTGVPQTEYCLVWFRVYTSVLRSIDQSVH